MKMKTNINLTKTQSFIAGILYVVILTLIGWQFIYQSKAYFEDILKPSTVIKEVVKVETKEIEPTNPDAWVSWRIAKAGLNPIEAMVVISKESGYKNNDNKFNVNKNGTIDLSRWMINSIHYGKPWKHWQTGEEKTLTIECVGSFKCSTDWAISKRLKDGNWSAWYGAKAAGIN